MVHPYFKLASRHNVEAYLNRAKRSSKSPRGILPPAMSWTIPGLCAAYGWPAGNAPGRGVIGIVELGGGWLQSDVTTAFAAMRLPAPVIVDVSVDKGMKNAPGGDADGEVALDIQVAAGAYTMATGLAAQVRMYWGNDIARCVMQAHADGCDVCSISWGADEASWGADELDRMEAAVA